MARRMNKGIISERKTYLSYIRRRLQYDLYVFFCWPAADLQGWRLVRGRRIFYCQGIWNSKIHHWCDDRQFCHNYAGDTKPSAVALATAGHNRATLAQQGLSGAALVSFPCLASKTAHRATQGRVWVHHFFLERFCPGRTAKSRSSL